MIDIARYAQPLDRGKAALDEFARVALNHDPVWLPPLAIDFGATDVRVPPSSIFGQRGATRLQCQGLFAPTGGCAFELSNGTLIDGMTLENNAAIDQQACAVGFGSAGAGPGSRASVIRNTDIIGHAWGLYLWGEYGDQLSVEDSTVTAGHICVGCLNSGGDHGQVLDMLRVYIKGDPSLSSYQGAVTNNVYGGTLGVAVRSGIVRMWDCRADLLGAPNLRCVGVTDDYDMVTERGLIELHNFDCRILNNVAREQFDIDIRQMPLKYRGGSGSGPNGAYTINQVAPGSVTKFGN